MSARNVPTRFAVAFSLAGEQRQLVLPVVQEVEAVLGRSAVFYDDWYEHWIAGNDADLLLQQIYGEMSDLVVVCISGNYGSKPWTRTEHRAIRARIMNSSSKAERREILPLRFGDGEVEGVLLNEVVPDLRKRPPTEAAELIIARLNLVRGPAEGSAPADIQWPVDAPVLQWPIADHREPRAAFATVLTAASPVRALLIQGPSETGKTHMSKQMTRNVIGLPGMTCGRFDFKGTTNMNVEVEAFSEPLGIEPPEGNTLNERLGKIFKELRRRAQPTVFIFDAYESAGDVQAWIEGVLLQYLVSATWLRVVVIGQSVPIRAGTTWESIAANTIRLQAPGLDDWFQYGREHRGMEVEREFVAKAHHLADGKASLLATLLGPRS
jgi:hypothetical protein